MPSPNPGRTERQLVELRRQPLASAAPLIRTIVEEVVGTVAGSRVDAAELRRWQDEIPIVSDVRGRGLIRHGSGVPGTRKLLDKKVTR